MSNNYLPLHHKYRPKCFDDLVGQESIVSTLKQALLTNRIAPAYLFCGPRGTGKTSSARILARSLNCLETEKPTIKPCGECNLCQEIGKGIALDVIEIDAASNTGVDNIRELIEKAQFAPVQARWKIYVIDECHMLSTAAFNALLKTLEEPPSKTVFILATTDPQRVLQTILSRCQRFDFRRIPMRSLITHLQGIASKENIDIDIDSIELIAQRAEGGLRDAESLLDQLSLLKPPVKLESVWQLLGEVPEKELINMAAAVSKKDPISLLNIVRMLFDNGKEPIDILQGFTSILRDLLIIKALGSDSNLCNISNNSYPELAEIGKTLELENILYWQTYLKGSESQIRASLQPRLWLEVLLLGMLNSNDINRGYKDHKVEFTNQKDITNTVTPNQKDITNTITSNQVKLNEEVKIIEAPNNSKDLLLETWKRILSQVELPSTRMLLSQQAQLTDITKNKAEISISENWMGMIQSRKGIIENAIQKSIGGTRELIFQKQINRKAQEDKDLDRDKDLFKNDQGKEQKGNFIQDGKTNDKKDNLITKETESFAKFFNGEVIDEIKDNE
ncbi:MULTISPECIES: DNA polymerase III subunit gamma/tau [unclassified Prochlorococcus]|uniref:DNA polymerase III subunit gamma/tau n=1 Tax=unclassified Prochlorococcus TaxID=2627481 RepID=UPI0005337467|nr:MULTISPECIES: DNA polymerase III subunit gamma/tau [unclassified Prochlorococcus]KGG14565.1 DNA polymerasee III subunits gamma and tau [Prochlorococcus sp. MIT 0602]KGG16009.1 DNA polymerasee III subunits gamma and tau [Prochlorococcus sp. MIT 0603]